MSEERADSVSASFPLPDAWLAEANLRPLELIAYEIHSAEGWSLEPATSRREWMAANDNFAYRCLPLTIANAAGWQITCPVSLTAVWNGGLGHRDVRIEFEDPYGQYARNITSHFGAGIVTFNLPWLFRTSRPRVGLAVRGLPNYPKYNATPLEGFVETDWLPFTFTMNWKIDRPHVPVMFTKGEPICFIQPTTLDFVEATAPRVEKLSTNPKLAEEYHQYDRARAAFNADPRRQRGEWQKFYHVGEGAPDHHRTAIKPAAFARA